MKIIYTILIYLSFVHYSFAQIQITNQNLPSTGDNLEYTNVIGIGIDVEPKNEGHHWDFRELTSTNEDIQEFKASNNTPYILNFGFNAIGLKIADSLGAGDFAFQDLYSFFKKSSTAWEAVGIGFRLPSIPFPIAGRNSKNDVIYKLPLKYMDEYEGDFAVDIPLGLGFLKIGDFFQSGDRETVVDGYGFISTPTRDSVACLRVKSVVNRYDSISLTQPSTINFGFSSVQVEYKWLSVSDKIPVLEVSGIQTGNTFVPNITRFAGWVETNEDDLRANFTASQTEISEGTTVDFEDLSAGKPDTWDWNITPSSGWTIESGSLTSQNMSVTFNDEGKYTISLKIKKDSDSETHTKTDYIQVNKNVGVNRINSNEIVKIYPNPSNLDFVTFNSTELIEVLFIYDSFGKLIEVVPSPENQFQLDISSYARGTYLSVIKVKDSVIQQKFTVQ
jgi:PKD repeat protein